MAVQPAMSIDSILREQGGVISRHQATAAGLAPAVVDDRLRRRQWRPLHPRVYLARGRPADPEVRIRAAMLWAGEGAALTGAAAAWWFGLLSRPPSTVTVAVPRRAPRGRPGIVVARRALPAVDVVEHRGLRLTGYPLTVLEAAVELGAAGAPLLDRALRTWLPLRSVHGACDRHPSASARQLLDAAASRSDGAARRLLVRLLRDSGTPGWCPAGTVPGSIVAVVFPGARVAVEVGGWARPVPEPRPPVGRRGPAVRAGPGWTVLRFHWSDLVSRPQGVLAEIAAAVADLAPAAAG